MTASLPAAHGYTMGDLDRLTRSAIARTPAYAGIDTDERYAAGWHAAAELLLTAEQRPTPREIVTAALRAADRESGRTAEAHGHGRARGESGRADRAMPRFWAYWGGSDRCIPSPETAVVERVALAQVWPALTGRQQEAVRALADTGSPQAAAERLGITLLALSSRLKLARGRANALWHEGETPPRLRRDIRAVGRLRADASGRPRLTEADLDVVRDRRAAGSTVEAIADEYGCSHSTVSRLLSGRTRAAPAAA